MNNNQNEFNLWFSQAKFDLEAAKTSLMAGNYEWACFQAQQSAEKALKAYLYLQGKRLIIIHSINKLLQECNKINNQFQTINETRALDLYYIPIRYPNGLPDQIPHEFYKQEDAELCVNYAELILSLIDSLTKK